MNPLAIAAVVLVAVLHLAFLVLEMFLWRTPYGARAFGIRREHVDVTALLAANQGLYNGFLAAGLIWSVVDPQIGPQLAVFFLGCVIVAGVFGAVTVKRSILFIQALPAVIALALVLGM